MSKVKYIMIFVLVILIIVIGIMANQLSNITIRQTKDYAVIYVDPKDCVDFRMFLNPTEKYKALRQINSELRVKVAGYMKDNNLKLAAGKQEFVRNNPTFEELIENGFKFQQIN